MGLVTGGESVVDCGPQDDQRGRVFDQGCRTVRAGASADVAMMPPDCFDAVVALLVKTGRGQLSAQFRMAYAWCLREGYDGVITVDGNGKDDQRAIPAFLDRLCAGFDYVQGSRYLPGGAGINTPPDRKLAGRLVHAPLLSLAARHRYTDTTNGFCAYSRAYLADPRVAPFRSVFNRYELLFYLTLRPGQSWASGPVRSP